MLTTSEQQRLIRDALSLAQGRGSGRMFQTLGRRFGPFGEILGLVADSLSSSRKPSNNEIVQAIRLLTSAGFDVRPGGTTRHTFQPPPSYEPEIIEAEPVPRDRSAGSPRRGSVPTVPSVSRSGSVPRIGDVETSWPEEHFIDTQSRSALLVRRDQSIFTDDRTHYFPGSSNVYSATYDEDQQVAYIAFKIGKAQEYVDKINSCNGSEYKMGIKPNTQGPMYAYGGRSRPFTPAMWDSFLSAPSKGEWVWHNLRKCGSRHEHQLPYNLVSPARIGGGLIYTPRKVTRRGYRVRRVAVPGTGRRRSVRSTLPEQLF